MESLVGSLLTLFESNILSYIILYSLFCVGSIWLLLSFWVAYDSYKRSKNVVQSILFTLLTIIFNIPGLIFYLLARKERLDEDFSNFEANEDVERYIIPLTELTNKNGDVNLRLDLNLSKIIRKENFSDIKEISDKKTNNLKTEKEFEKNPEKKLENKPKIKFQEVRKKIKGQIKSKAKKIKLFSKKVVENFKNFKGDI